MFPKTVQQLAARIAVLNATVFSPYRGEVDPSACEVALGAYGGFWGPFVDVHVEIAVLA